MKNIYVFIGASALMSLAAGCAKEATISSNEQTKTYIEAWVQVNHPDAVPSGAGIYILDDTPGDGKAYDGQTYPMISYTVRSMEGTISSTTEEDIAKQVGEYEKGNYYGAKVWVKSDATMPVGIENMLEGMKIGGTRTALIPSWLMGYSRYDDNDEYIKHSPSKTSTAVYTITLTDFTNDITQWEINSMEGLIKEVFPGLDSTGRGFYVKEVEAPRDTTSFKKDTTVYINYIGRLLNGQVFDTTIKDTAKKYGIYSSSSTYEPRLINWGEKFEDLTMSADRTTIISGFQRTLWKMRSHGKYVGIFNSSYGYGQSGNGTKIPPFCPLIFEIEQVDPKE